LDGETIIAELKRYEGDLAGILSRFTRSRDGIHIGRGDDPLFQQYVRKLVDYSTTFSVALPTLLRSLANSTKVCPTS
jgi:hypothetical protein